MRALFVILIGCLLAGCSAQISGMQSPVLHDHGSINWLPLNRSVEQTFITGPGYSAAIENDAGTTPAEYLERLGDLPEDARTGDLNRLRVGLRLSGRDDAAWSTGARIQLAYSDDLAGRLPDEFTPLLDLAVDALPRSGDRVVIDDLPEIEPGRIAALRLVPGDGPDAGRLQVGFTPYRAPYGGWQAVLGEDELNGAIVYDTRYQTDVAIGEVIDAGWQRFRDAGVIFLTLYTLAIGTLTVGCLLLLRKPRMRTSDGR